MSTLPKVCNLRALYRYLILVTRQVYREVGRALQNLFYTKPRTYIDIVTNRHILLLLDNDGGGSGYRFYDPLLLCVVLIPG